MSYHNYLNFNKYIDFKQIEDDRNKMIDNCYKDTDICRYMNPQHYNYIKFFNENNPWNFKVVNGFNDFYDPDKPSQYIIEKWCPKWYEEYHDYWVFNLYDYILHRHPDYDALP